MLSPSTGMPLILHVTSGSGLPCTWQSRRAVSPGPYKRLWGLCSQYGAAAGKGRAALSSQPQPAPAPPPASLYPIMTVTS